jgi:pimeloyl-ACP methyl ester carboxylesterase
MKRLVTMVVGLMLFSCHTLYALDVIKEDVRIPMELRYPLGIKTINLSASIYRLDTGNKLPLVVLNHGTPRDSADRKQKIDMERQSKVFVKRGFVAVMPARRGYGDSEGEWAEDIGRCDNPDYHSVGKEGMEDLRAVVNYMRKKPYIDPAKIIMVGQSGGGFAALAYASVYSDGLVGVINFAGGRGPNGPHKLCSPERLIATMGDYGKTSRTPTLWIYSEKDVFFPPPFPRKMFEAYQKYGGEGKLVLLTSEQTIHGHNLFIMGVSTWEPIVDEFLRELHLLQ